MIPGLRIANRTTIPGLVQEVLDHGNHAVWFGEQREMAGVRDHCQLRIGEVPHGIHGVLNSDEVPVAQRDEKRCPNGSELLA